MIKEQLELENEMVGNGIARYNRIQDRFKINDRESETTYAKRLIPEYVTEISDRIENDVHARRVGSKAKYIGLIKGQDYLAVSFITMKVVFDALTKRDTITNLAIKIGTKIEDQIKFNKFEAEHSDYFTSVQEDFKRRNNNNYAHRKKVMSKKMTDLEVSWESWTLTEKLHLGIKMLGYVIDTGLVHKRTYRKGKNNTVVCIEATEDTMNWIEKHIEYAEVLQPETLPCIIKPADWTSVTQGGYYSPELRRRVPMIKTKGTIHSKFVKKHDKEGSYDLVKKALNTMQGTAWTINTKVHDVIKEVWDNNLGIGMPESQPYTIPESPVAHLQGTLEKGVRIVDYLKSVYGEESEEVLGFLDWKKDAARAHQNETERRSKSMALARTLVMAKRFRDYDKFYFVYQCDFRGRIYAASPGLNPQGADFSKGLLMFSEGKKITREGIKWLAIHGANTFGEDKVSYEDRIKWVKENTPAILNVAKEPLSSSARSFWSDSDKPYQFLAFCFEWAGVIKDGEDHITRIPVGLDGSCNGLQHFSAMLRDEVGGSAVNITPGDKPNDIYQRVADVVRGKLDVVLGSDEYSDDDKRLARSWITVGINRKITKKPVMTLPYGSTRQTCRESIYDYLRENAAKYPEWDTRNKRYYASAFLSRLVWSAIGEVVVAACDAMSWLQKTSRVATKNKKPLTWTTPSGFAVYQGTRKRASKRIKTQLNGDLFLTITEDTNELDVYKQASGSAPNFVHSMDASHLVLTVLLGTQQGITDYAMIHDDFGTHACNAGTLQTAIQTMFAAMYNKHDVLQELSDSVCLEDTPELPARGNLKITDVLKADYFFG